jgi:hypothetical protein
MIVTGWRVMGRRLARKQIEGGGEEQSGSGVRIDGKPPDSPDLICLQDVQDICSRAVSNHGQRPGWITNGSGKETARYRNIHFGNNVVVGG